MRTSESVAEVSKALVAFQKAVESPKKTKTANTGTYSYTYADFDDITAGIRELLAANGLAFAQEAVSGDGRCGVTTRLIHTSGEWMEGGPLFLPAGNTPQAYGSAITYAKRYQLTSMLGIATEEDDDGAAAQRSQRAKNGAQKRQPKQENVVQMDPLKAKVVELSKAVKDERVPTEIAAGLIAEWFGEGKASKDLDAAQLETAALGVRRYAASLRQAVELLEGCPDELKAGALEVWDSVMVRCSDNSWAPQDTARPAASLKELVTMLEGLKAGADAQG